MTGEFAGNLSQRVELWCLKPERDDTGLSINEWSLIARFQAAVELMGAGPASEGMVAAAMERFRVTARYRDDVTLDCRLRWRGRTLAVRQVLSSPSFPDRVEIRCEAERA